MTAPLQILLVEDDEDDQLIARKMLSKAFGKGFVLDWVRSWEAAAEQIARAKHDVYLVDHGLGKRSGIELMREVASGDAAAPVIMLTGADDRELDLAAQAAGASDFLVKSELSAPLLDRAIRYAIESKKNERRLVRLAHFDPLTGLVNRSQFRVQLDLEIRHGRRGETLVALLLLDLDHFKDVNDTLGHPAGDTLLRAVAARLNSVVRDTDTVARLGGDEFAIIATHLADASDASVLAEKVLAVLSEPVPIDGHPIFVTASIGITLCPRDGDDPDQALSNADLALYKAKEQGRECFRFFGGELNTEALERKRIERELRSALERGALRLDYQPIVDLDSGEPRGVEALVRWRSDDGTWIAPDSMRSVAEASGLMVSVGEWALREACRQKAAWARAGIEPGPISINVAPMQVRRDEFFAELVRIIDASGVDPRGIEVEVTEGALMDKDDVPARRLSQLRERGVRLAIDEFGSGYSSLLHLKRFPVDGLKIDRGFLHAIASDHGDAAIVQAIVQLGASLDLDVIAVGVDDATQVQMLRERGCPRAQGPYFSEPLDADALVRWLDERRSAICASV